MRWMFATLWLATTVSGFGYLAYRSGIPGEAPQMPQRFPSGTTIAPASDKYTLLMFLHPQCGCSQASLSELERLLPLLKTPIALHFVFIRPHDKNEDWVKGRLWFRAAQVPGADLTIEAEDHPSLASFPARTSGHTLLYDHAGRLRFSGGLTPARGHEGDSVGRKALLDIINGPGEVDNKPTLTSSTFGCALHTSRKENHE